MTAIPTYFRHETGAHRFRITADGVEHLFGEHGLRGYLRGLTGRDDARIAAIVAALQSDGTWTGQGITIHRIDPTARKKTGPKGGSGDWAWT